MTTRNSRRELTREDWLKLAAASAGASVGVTLVITYFGRLFLQKYGISAPERSRSVAVQRS